MPLWRIIPIAQPDDPRWMGGPIFEEVLIEAPLASTARVAAAEMEARMYPYAPIRNHAGLEALAFPSSFYDEKLYHVEQAAEASGTGRAKGAVAVIGYRMRGESEFTAPAP